MRSANAMNADVSTYASFLVAVDGFVDFLAGISFPALDHAGVAHPRLTLVPWKEMPQRASQQLRQGNPQAAASALAARYSRSLKLICVRIMITILVDLLPPKKLESKGLSKHYFDVSLKLRKLHERCCSFSLIAFMLVHLKRGH